VNAGGLRSAVKAAATAGETALRHTGISTSLRRFVNILRLPDALNRDDYRRKKDRGEQEMALTKDFRETTRERAQQEPCFQGVAT